eukprot:3714766-Pyramimonas_sp.AAC.1
MRRSRECGWHHSENVAGTPSAPPCRASSEAGTGARAPRSSARAHLEARAAFRARSAATAGGRTPFLASK